jgi:uncharacterized cofD-like protein
MTSPFLHKPKDDFHKIVIIGGGTGIGPVIRGLKQYGGSHITVICTTFDSGGHTRVLRDEHGWLPQGDIRRAFVALDTSHDNTLRFLFTDRFKEKGGEHDISLGNQIIWRLQKEFGEREGLKRLHNLFKLGGQVLPVSFERADLVARLDDGTVIHGETDIDTRDQNDPRRIQSIWLESRKDKGPVFLNAEAEEAIIEADLIIVGPGDLYSSIIAALLVRGMSDAISASRGKLVYVPNLMTKAAETPGFTAADFCRVLVNELEPGRGRLIGRQRFDAVFVNTATVPAELLAHYSEKEKSQPVRGDDPAVREELERMSKRVIFGDYVDQENLRGGLIRHDDHSLARAIRVYLDEEYERPLYEVIVDLDDTLCLTTQCGLRENPKKLSTLTLAPGAVEFLEHFDQVTLLTQGEEKWQQKKIDQLGLRKYFKQILIVPGPKEKLETLIVYKRFAKNGQLVVVGDRLDSEIYFGNKIGIPTIRVKHPSGRYSKMEPRNQLDRPTHTVADLHEALALLKRRHQVGDPLLSFPRL